MHGSKFYFFLSLFFLYFLHPVAGQHFTISGYIRDAKTGEDIIGANVTIKELPGKGSSTNTYGYYSITLPAGRYQISTQYVGYTPQNKDINLDKSQKVDFQLTEQINELSEVVVSSQRKNENVTRLEMGTQKLDTKDLKTIPVLFGEKDVLKTIQLLPGIKSAGEGNSGLMFGAAPVIRILYCLTKQPCTTPLT